MKKMLRKLLNGLMLMVRALAAVCAAPFVLIFHLGSLSVLSLVAVLLGLIAIPLVGGIIYVAACGILHWLSVTNVFETHPFISFFVLFVVLEGLFGTCCYIYQEYAWQWFEKKEKTPEPRKTRLP